MDNYQKIDLIAFYTERNNHLYSRLIEYNFQSSEIFENWTAEMHYNFQCIAKLQLM